MTPGALLAELRGLGIRVRIDGEQVRCKAPDGVPTQLAALIKLMKPQLLDLLRTEEDEIAWRVRDLASDLLEQPAELMPGVCSFCGRAVPNQQSGKCVLCCLAAAQMVRERLDATGSIGQTTYPMSSGSDRDPETQKGLGDMSPAERDAA